MTNSRLVNIIITTTSLLLLVVLLFETTSIDMLVQQRLFEPDLHSWLLDRDAQPWRFLMYDGIKKLFIVMTLSLVWLVASGYKRLTWFADRRKELLVVLLTMLCVPIVVNFLKWYTDIPCPRDIRSFGGIVPYITLFDHYPSWFHHESSLRCYPAGHASGGFALMSLFFLFKQKKYRLIGFATGLCLGWVTGVYKMAIGDHFLSHTIISMLLAWLVACLVAYFVLFRRRSDTVSEVNDYELSID